MLVLSIVIILIPYVIVCSVTLRAHNAYRDSKPRHSAKKPDSSNFFGGSPSFTSTNDPAVDRRVLWHQKTAIIMPMHPIRFIEQ